MANKKEFFINRDISWLFFNERVLQEAQDNTVPLIDRAKFLGIFSNNLDEFFRVRVATLKRMQSLGKGAVDILHEDPKILLERIQEIVIRQQLKFDKTYKKLIREFEKENIIMLDEKSLNEEQLEFVLGYFRQKIRPSLVPIMLTPRLPFPELKDRSIYLAIKLGRKKKGKSEFALVEVPSEVMTRIVVLPTSQRKNYIILLDDIIRVGLKEIFAIFQCESIDAYTIKITRDAELDISEDVSESIMSKISKSLENRKQGQTVRFIYDQEIPQDLLDFIIKKNGFRKGDNIIPGGRYHNFKDFMKFPEVGSPKLRYTPLDPVEHPKLKNEVSLLSVIRRKDILLHFPYQSFHYVIDILREAAINPNVKSIKMTMYRVAENSRVINALVNAAKNGKSVTVVIELQARFDEENNITWAKRLQEEGLRVIFGVPGLKVHSKLILIREKMSRKTVNYAHIGTGNFHEGTARLYTDLSLFTCNSKITNEVAKVFEFFKDNYKRHTYRTLFVSPTNTRRNFIKLIETEIRNAKQGKEAFIIIKLNNLVDEEMIEKLYEASEAGVRIDLIVRGTCALVPGIRQLSSNIRAISIVDRLLEHSRVFVFCNGGNGIYLISSADWMARNLDKRIEVTTPILDRNLQKQIRDILDIYLSANVKARVLDINGTNKYVKQENGKVVRSQEEVYKFYRDQLE